ncbi:ABC transporter permease [Georgenia thermotolerans]|uniref:ABC transporter permease subunit n=1 Tax=Georgenia thermotolerans TaxID=527326 RepID=A0A7J5UM25_9MICO|nr:ABC transporter permease [Georgenia thermotolerans]KAE8763340.1 ABC transporter permease subunit [Georgenia thermotolerans]
MTAASQPRAAHDPLTRVPPEQEIKARRRLTLGTKTKGQKRFIRYTALVVILVVWEIYGRSVNPVLFTYPTAIVRAFFDMIEDGTLGTALVQTGSVLLIGLVIGTVIGIAVGLLAGRSEVVKQVLDIPINALYALPAVALIPVIVLWFGFGSSAKIFVVTFFVFFPVVINTTRGVEEVDPELLEVTRSFCSSESRVWRDLLLPGALPYIFTGIRLAIGRGLVGVIVAEFFTAISGLGNLIVTNSNTFQTARTFVPIVILALIGVVLTAILVAVEKRMAPWRPER